MAASSSSTHHLVEFDFFRMEKEKASSQPQTQPSTAKIYERKRSFRDIQGGICKMNPEIVKAVIDSNPVSVEDCHVQSPSAAKKHQIAFPSYSPASSYSSSGGDHHPIGAAAETAPMTIFYNGNVAVFDVHPQQAENILNIAEKGVEFNQLLPLPLPYINHLLFSFDHKGLPLIRRNSLKSFLDKRKHNKHINNIESSNDDIIGNDASLDSGLTDDDEEKYQKGYLPASPNSFDFIV